MNPSDVDPDHVRGAQSPATPREQAETKAKFNDLKRRATGLESTIEAHIEAAEQEARDRAAVIVAQAEHEAEEIRADTKAVVDQARGRVNELMRLRQALFATLRETLGNFEDAITRAEDERTFTEAAAAQPEQVASDTTPAASSEQAMESEQSAEPPQAVEPGESEGQPAKPPSQPPKPAEPGLETGGAETAPMGPVVNVEVGPLRDYEAVSAVERAFGALPGIHGVYLRSFDNGVAVFEAFGVNVNMLLSSMRASFTIPFILRSANAGRLVLQVDESAPHREDL